MVNQTVCECGHANPAGTELCQSCGKPFEDDNKNLLNMRYEGAARRSQTYSKTIIDRIWNFFSSVKVGIWFMVITLVASIFGTIFPQQLYIPRNVNPFDFYSDEYGFLGYIYVALGFHNMYSSWWYVGLLVMIGVSLVISSIDRAVPLYKALKTQRVTRHVSFLSRQKIHAKSSSDQPNDVLVLAKEALAQKRYNVREEERAILGEKGRFTRWGPYVVHLGLIVFLIGTLIRILPGFALEEEIWVREGETVPVTGTEFYVKNEGFFLDTYDPEEFPALDKLQEAGQEVAREFRTEAVLYEPVLNEATGESELVEVKRHSIIVNDPLVYKRLKLFQSQYIPNEFSEFVFSLKHKETGESIGEVAINLSNPERYYPLEEGYQVELVEYYPDYEIDENNMPTTKSDVPNNPAFIFRVQTPDNPKGELSWASIGINTAEREGAPNQYALKIKDIKMNNVTGLMVRRDVSLPVISVGGFIVMIGLVLCFYWQHRRIWVQSEGQEIWLAAHTNKNWFGIRNEIEYVIDHAKINIDKETLDKEDRS
jgi:cytochrome c biogenesis protein